MPITLTCPGCQGTFRLPESLAGRKARCEKCAAVFGVPAIEGAPVSIEAPVVVPSDTSESPTKPNEQVYDAQVTKPPPPIEVIEAVLVGPAVEDRKSAERRPVAREVAPRRRQPTKRPAANSGIGNILTIVAILFLAGFCLVSLGGIALWIFIPNRARQVELAEEPKQIKDPLIVGEQKKLEPKIIAQQGVPELPLDPDGRAMVAENAVAGNKSYRVHLQQNKQYNFFVNGLFGFPARLTVTDGADLFVARETNNAAFLTLTAKRTGEHTITVSPRFGVNNGAFDLHFAPVEFGPPRQIEVAGKPSVMLDEAIRIQDPLLRELGGEPCLHREFVLQVKDGAEYPLKLTIQNQNFRPALVLKNGAQVISQTDVGFNNRIDLTYKANYTGKLTILVATRANMLGNFTLTVTEDLPGPRTVAFDLAGRYLRDDSLGNFDPFDARLGRVKTYHIPMEAGQGYNIDQRSTALDAFLTLYGPDGKIVAEDNNSGGNFNARILFDPKVRGDYKLLASDFKKGTGAFTLEINKIKLPVSAPANAALKLTNRQQSGCDIVEASASNIANTVTSFAWAPDGKAFVLLHANSQLRRYRYPDFVEERSLDFGLGFWSLHSCSEGLLLSRTTPSEFWVIDPQSLELKRRLPRVGANIIHTSPTLDLAFTASNVIQAKGGGVSTGLAQHSLKGPGFLLFANLTKGALPQAVTPDGRFILARDQDGKMSRWRHDAKSVKVEETSAFIARPWAGQRQPYLVSPDGKLVVHPIDTKLFNNPRDNIQPAPASGKGIAIYKIGDLSKPLAVIDTQLFTTDVAFEPKTGLLCAFNKTKGLMLIDPYKGEIVRTLKIDLPDPFSINLWSLSAHPDGGALIGFNGNTFNPKLLAITLPKDLPAVKGE